MKHNRILSFLMLFLLLGNLFLGMSFTVGAVAPTVTTNTATGIEETNATLQGNLTGDYGKNCTTGFEYGLTKAYGNNVTIPAYIYVAGGWPTKKIYQCWRSNLTKKTETASLDYDITALAEDSTYIYAVDRTDVGNYISQFWKDNLTYKAQTTDYGGWINALIQDDIYIYVGGEVVNKVFQYWKSNMTKKAETLTYGGLIFSLTQDATYVYVGGETTNKVNQYWKSNMTYKAQTIAYGGTILALAEDDTYVYAGGYTTNKVNQYWKSNMTLKAQSANYGGRIYAIIEDSTYVYAGGLTNLTVKQYWKSNMTLKAFSSNYGGSIVALAQDDTHIYAGGYTTVKIYQYRKSNMTKKAESISYGAYILALSLSPDAYITTSFSYNAIPLLPGTLYHYRAYATNSNGTGYGSDEEFLTKPNAPTGLIVTDTASGQQTLTWTHGTGYNQSVVRGTIGSYPATPQSGVAVYNNTGATVVVNGLTGGDDWYYRVWEYTVWGTEYKFSDSYTSSHLVAIVNPTVTTNASTGVEETTARLNGYLTNDGGANCTVGFNYGLTKSYGTTILHSNYTLNLVLGWNYNITFPKYIWDYNTSIAANDSTSNFLTKGGILAKTIIMYEYNYTSLAWKSFAPLGLSNDLLNISDFTTNPELEYSIRTNAACTLFFDYDLSGVSLPYNYSININSLIPGKLYHFRAFATNSIGTGYGSDREFLTKPIEPASLTATANTTNISLTWTKGTGANNTYIERNVAASSWARGAGTLVYNSTGTSYKNTGLTPGIVYYYRAWSYAKWNASQQWSDINISSYALTKPEAPINTDFTLLNLSYIRLNWTKGTGANNTVVVKKTTEMPTSITDGTIVYNGTGLNVLQAIVNGQPTYYRAWSYTTWITPSLHQFSTNGTNFTIGGLYINCYDVNTHANLTFNVTISNPAGTQVYVNASCINTLQINATLCPQGIGIQVIVSAIGYKQSVYVLDIYPSIFYLLNTYLILATPTGTPSGNETSALYYLRVVETIQTTYTQVDQAVEDALVTVKRYINATGVYETISSLYTDANGYVNLYLAPNGYYKVFINKSGYYDKISDYIPAPPNAFGQTVEKVFRILLIAANVTPPPSYLWSDYITFIGSMNNATSIIYVNYTDALTNTTDWQLFIYRIDPNSTTPTLVKSWSGTNDTFALSKNVTDSTDDYKVVFHVNHTNFGYQVRELYFFGYHAKLTSAAKFNLLFTLNYGYNPFGWANTFMFFVILGCFFSFGRRETYMAVFAIGILLLFMNFYIGIETVWSALAGGAFPIILIFFGILMLVRDRTFSGAS